MGADYYESPSQRVDHLEQGTIPLGVGAHTTIHKAIVEKNARIGRHVRIVNDAHVHVPRPGRLGLRDPQWHCGRPQERHHSGWDGDLAGQGATPPARGFAKIGPFLLAQRLALDREQPEAGLAALATALTIVDTPEKRWWEAELYRLKGARVLQASVYRPAADVVTPGPRPRRATLRRKSASTTPRHGPSSAGHVPGTAGGDEPRPALAAAGPVDRGPRAAGPIHGWFTEGFDTADVQEAKALLEALGGERERAHPLLMRFAQDCHTRVPRAAGTRGTTGRTQADPLTAPLPCRRRPSLGDRGQRARS